MAGHATQPETTDEEEAIKRNTDCVYFLASPLTCKKGSECEYRHSEIARVNPRDCWFWLNGNCLNAKCGFRHPPLDGLIGAQVPTPTGPSVPQKVFTPQVQNTSGRQGVPCVFFQKGFCGKGDWCPFMHAPNPVSNKASVTPISASTPESETFKKTFGGPEKPLQEKKVVPPPGNVAAKKPIEVPPQLAKPAAQVETAPPRKISQTPINEFIGYTPNIRPGVNENPVRWSPRVKPQPHMIDGTGSCMNLNDPEDFSREPSPGFDVLVDDDDDEQRDSDYYPNEDQYRMSRERESMNEYDVSRSIDYNMIPDIDHERYRDSHLKGWDQQRASSERKPYPTLGRVDESDLRHHLAKHKKANGLRSVISHEPSRDRRVDDRRFHDTRREENPLSSRLRGRIRLPGRSSSPSDRGIIRRNDRVNRSSPVRRNGRIQDRIKGRVVRENSDNGENFAGFAGPKSLSELKNRKDSAAPGRRDHVTDQQSLGKRKHVSYDVVHQEPGNGIAFEGPKPLEEILKRKRGGWNSSKNEGNDDGPKIEAKESQSPLGDNNSARLPDDASKVQSEEGVMFEDGEAGYEQEEEGGGDSDSYTGQNGEAEGEYIDGDEEEEEDDDFAKKMGVMYS